MGYWQNIRHPENFHGSKKKDRYFEGWYFKMVSSDERHTIALIPGVSINQEDPHAFIQVFLSRLSPEGVSLKTYYLRESMSAFSFRERPFGVRIASNDFSMTGLRLDLAVGSFSLQGEVSFSEITPIRTGIFQPNIMGFFGYATFMECYHGVLSMSQQLSGHLRLAGETIDFEDGKGYIEKDWGRSFPREYVWIQSNHFHDPSASFLFSYADIPFLGLNFRGLIANLMINGKEYRFATYNGGSVRRENIQGGAVFYELRKGRLKLEIQAASDHQIGLPSPRNGRMVEEIKEGLSGTVHLRLFRGKALIFDDTGRHAGIEIMKRHSPSPIQ